MRTGVSSLIYCAIFILTYFSTRKSCIYLLTYVYLVVKKRNVSYRLDKVNIERIEICYNLIWNVLRYTKNRDNVLGFLEEASEQEIRVTDEINKVKYGQPKWNQGSCCTVWLRPPSPGCSCSIVTVIRDSFDIHCETFHGKHLFVALWSNFRTRSTEISSTYIFERKSEIFK